MQQSSSDTLTSQTPAGPDVGPRGPSGAYRPFPRTPALLVHAACTLLASRHRAPSSLGRPTSGAVMKKLINDPGDVVAEALRGIAGAHSELRVDHQHRVV